MNKPKRINIGPLPRRYGATPRGGLNAAKRLVFCNLGPLSGSRLWLTPGLGSLPVLFRGEACPPILP